MAIDVIHSTVINTRVSALRRQGRVFVREQQIRLIKTHEPGVVVFKHDEDWWWVVMPKPEALTEMRDVLIREIAHTKAKLKRKQDAFEAVVAAIAQLPAEEGEL